jgi:hypothetical protein
MNKKGSMELSVNSIVILVIAIVMLGLILGFVKSKFSDVGKGLDSKEPDAPQPSASEPLTLSRTELLVSPGDTGALKIRIFNPSVSPTVGTYPNITCTAMSNVLYTARDLKAATEGNYIVSFAIPSSKAKSSYLCQVNASNIGEVNPVDFVVKVQ